MFIPFTRPLIYRSTGEGGGGATSSESTSTSESTGTASEATASSSSQTGANGENSGESTGQQGTAGEGAGASSGAGTGTEGTGETGTGTEGNDGESDEAAELDKAVAELAKLDPELANNPAIAKRWQEQQQGVTNIVGLAKEAIKEAKESAQWFDENLPRVQNLVNWGELLITPDTAPASLRDLVTECAKATNMSLHEFCEDLLQELGTQKNDQEIDEDEIEANWEQKNFKSPDAYRAYQQGILDAKKADRARARADAAKAREEAANNSRKGQRETFIKNVAPGIVNTVKSQYKGFQVTPEQVADAIEKHPSLAGTPLKAVVKEFAEQLLEHEAKQRTKNTPEVPEQPGGSTSTSGTKQLPPIKDRTAKHYFT